MSEDFSGLSVGSEEMVVAMICIDARKIGSAARFARRSCRPNTQVSERAMRGRIVHAPSIALCELHLAMNVFRPLQLRHVIRAGKLHVLLVSTESIERGTEVSP